MTCVCCLGLMKNDQFLDLESPYGQMWAASLRCGNCGHVHDSAIRQFHPASQEKGVALPRVSRNIRMTKSILELNPSSDERPDRLWLCEPSMRLRRTGLEL